MRAAQARWFQIVCLACVSDCFLDFVPSASSSFWMMDLGINSRIPQTRKEMYWRDTALKLLRSNAITLLCWKCLLLTYTAKMSFAWHFAYHGGDVFGTPNYNRYILLPTQTIWYNGAVQYIREVLRVDGLSKELFVRNIYAIVFVQKNFLTWSVGLAPKAGPFIRLEGNIFRRGLYSTGAVWPSTR